MIKKAFNVSLVRAAIRLLQVVGIVTDNYRKQDTSFIGLSKPYEKFGTLNKELLHKIVIFLEAIMHPDP